MNLVSLLLASSTWATPFITLPIDAQFPPVAIVSRPFRYQFAPTTFVSGDGTELRYTIKGEPGWLDLYSNTRMLSGVPSTEHLGWVTFLLVASDATGTTEQRVSLFVQQSSSLHATSDITDQLERYGSLSGYNTLTYRTNMPFSISFTPRTFSGSEPRAYYATSSDHTPLPSWIHFDTQTLTFSGSTPPLSAIPQTFGITLIASRLKLYSDASITFFIVVNDHQLAFQPYERFIDLKEGQYVLNSSLMSHLFLDGSPILRDQVLNATSDSPTWLKLNPHSLTLAGRPPSDLSKVSLRIKVRDVYRDEASTVIHFNFQPSPSPHKIKALKVVVGQCFHYNISHELEHSKVNTTSLNLNVTVSWLHYNSTSLILYGFVPRRTQPQVILANVTMSLAATTHTQAFRITVVESKSALGNKPQNTHFRNRPPNNSRAHKTTSSNSSHSKAKIKGVLSLGAKVCIGIGCAALICALVGLFVYCLRKRSNSRSWPAQLWFAIGRRRDYCDRKNYSSENERTDVEKVSTVENNSPRAKALQLGAGILKHKRNSTSSFVKSFAQTTFNNLNQDHLAEGQSGIGSTELNISPTVVATKPSEEPGNHRKAKRASRHSSRRKSGLPNERVLVGLGHGRASDYSLSRATSWHRALSQSNSSAWSTINSTSDRSFSFRNQMEQFPITPQRSSKRAKYTARSPKALNVRAVSTSDRSSSQSAASVAENRTLEQKRHSYIRRRASASRPSVLFGSDIGDTPSQQSSSKWSRLRAKPSSRQLLRRSEMCRSQSSSIGIPAQEQDDPYIIYENIEKNCNEHDNQDKVEESSTYSTQEGDNPLEGLSGRDREVQALRDPRRSLKLIQSNFNSCSDEAFLEDIEDQQATVSKQEIPSGGKVQRLVSTGTCNSNESSGTESLRFL